MSLTGSLLQIYPFDFKPSAPPSGSFLLYIKNDNVLYIQDSTGIEYAFADTSPITQLSGEATAMGPGNATITLSNSAVIGKVLTGYTVGANSPILATDTILQAFEKIQGQLDASSTFAITALTGDVSATGPGSVPGTVNSVGGSSASNVHSAELAANAATNLNTASTIVKRDSSGNFTAGTIIASLSGNATTATTATNFSGSLSGDVTGTQSATSISNATVTGKLLTGFSSAPGTVTATDSILSAIDKLDGNINTSVAAAITGLTGDVSASGPGNVTATISTAAPTTNLDSTTTNTAGSVSHTFSNSAHTHAITTATPVTQLPDQSNAAGTAAGLAKADHVHNIPSAVPVQIGTTNIQGSSTAFSLADHVHSHGSQTNGALHAVVTHSVNGFMSSADKIILDAATSSNTASTIVERDASGNFSAGTITASLAGNATTSTSFTGSLAGDVTGTQSATAVSAIQGTTVSGTTGTTNVVFSASPTLTGTITAASVSMSGTLASSNTSTTAVTVNTNSFVVDATNNTIGLGIQPSSNTILDSVNSTAASKTVQMTGYGVGSTVGTRGRFARGTSGSPAAAQSGDILNFWSARGYGTSQFAAASTAAISAIAGETFTNTSNLTYIALNTTPTGSVTAAESMRVASTGVTLGPQSSSTAIHQSVGGWIRTTKTITSNYTVDTTTTDDIILCNHSGAITITLPTPTVGRTIVIKDRSGAASTNNITVAQHASETIEGLAASKVLSTNFGAWTFHVGTAGNWWLV